MTLDELQKYLDEEKWKESENCGYDMCGRYARCRYCNRFDSYPCAKAHNKLVEVQNSQTPDMIPEWLLPEPPVMEVFGAEIAEEAEEVVEEQPSQTEKTVIATLTKAEAEQEIAVAAQPAEGKAERVPVINVFSEKEANRVCVLRIVRR